MKYPCVKFMRDSGGKLTPEVLVVVKLNEENETTNWYSITELERLYYQEQEREQEEKNDL